MKWVAIGSVMRWSIFAAAAILFVRDPRLVWLVPLIEVGAILCVVIFHFGVFRHSFGKFWRAFDRSSSLDFFLQALPIGLTQMMWGLKIYLPTIMLGLLIGGEEVGWFGASHRIIVALHGFVWMYYFNLYPSISRCANEKVQSLNALTGKSLEVTAWSAVFVGTFGTVAAEPLITFVYGSQYGQSVMAFRILIWLLSFTLLSGHYMYVLIAYNRQWLELSSAVMGAAASIVLNFVLIRRYGFIGAAWAVICAEALIWGLNYFFVRREVLHIRFLKYLPKPLAAGLITAAALLVVPSKNLCIIAVAGVLLYGTMIFILQPALINDVRMMIANIRQEA
jgi:O-antigen/teichoic acid export membrane protein